MRERCSLSSRPGRAHGEYACSTLKARSMLLMPTASPKSLASMSRCLRPPTKPASLPSLNILAHGFISVMSVLRNCSASRYSVAASIRMHSPSQTCALLVPVIPVERGAYHAQHRSDRLLPGERVEVSQWLCHRRRRCDQGNNNRCNCCCPGEKMLSCTFA